MTAIEIFKTIALVAGILIAPFIIAAAICVLALTAGLITVLLRCLFAGETNGDIARQKRQAEDEEQIKYLQEYNRKKREGKK